MMTDIEMDLYITQVEARILKNTVKEQEDQIANLQNHVKALNAVIEKQRMRLAVLEGGCADG